MEGRKGFLLHRVLPALLAGGAALFPLHDPDLGWHLAGGRLVLSGTFPVANTFSWTWPDHPWRFTQWLFGTLLALADRWGGTHGIHAVTAATAAAAFLLAAATARRAAPRGSGAPFAAFLLLAVTVARPRFMPRGDVATLAGLALVHHLCLARPRRLPLYLFLAAALWSNLHAGVVFGLLVVALHFGGRALVGEEGALREGARCGAAFLAGSLANPHLLYPYLYVIENLEASRRFPLVLAELRPPGLLGDPYFTALALLAAAAAARAAAGRRFDRLPLLAAPVLLGFYASRFTSFPALLALPYLAAELGEPFDGLLARARTRAGAAALAALLLAPPLALAGVELADRPPGLGLDRRRLPAAAAELLSARALSGRMFNEFNHGGFLAGALYPRQRVFVDGRGGAYPEEHFRAVAPGDGGGTAALVERWGVDVAVVDRRPATRETASRAPAFAALGWIPVHADGASYVFVRPGSPDAARSADRAFRWIRPWEDPVAPPATVLARPAAVAEELRRIDPATLLLPGDFRRFGEGALLAGDFALAARFLDEGRSLYPGDPSIRHQRALLLASTGRGAEAADELRWILSRHGGTPWAERARRDLAALGVGTDP